MPGGQVDSIIIVFFSYKTFLSLDRKLLIYFKSGLKLFFLTGVGRQITKISDLISVLEKFKNFFF